MALINCPECGRSNVSDSAKKCPGCGYPISENKSSDVGIMNNPKILIGIIGVVLALIFIIVAVNSCKEPNSRNGNLGYSNYSYSSNNDNSGRDAASIFRNLDIDDFSCENGKYSGKMQCVVTNNNNFTVRGYFRVNFYDNNGKLMYNQLMSLPDVAPGENVVCSTSIPKDDYPSGYTKVEFSQASLTDCD